MFSEWLWCWLSSSFGPCCCFLLCLSSECEACVMMEAPACFSFRCSSFWSLRKSPWEEHDLHILVCGVELFIGTQPVSATHSFYINSILWSASCFSLWERLPFSWVEYGKYFLHIRFLITSALLEGQSLLTLIYLAFPSNFLWWQASAREMEQLASNHDRFFQPDAINVHYTLFRSLYSADVTGTYLWPGILWFIWKTFRFGLPVVI